MGVAENKSAAPKEEPADNPTVEERVAAGQVAMVYGNTPPAVFVNIVGCILAYVVLWPATPTIVSSFWGGAFLAVNIVRGGLFIVWRRSPEVTRDASLWGRRMAIVLLATGLCWGAAGLLFAVCAGTLETNFCVMVLGGMTAGAVATIGAVRIAYFAFALPIGFLTIAGLLMRGDTMSMVTAGLAFTFELAMFGTVLRVNTLFRRNIELSFENDELVNSLATTAVRLGQANDELKREIGERERAEALVSFLASHDVLTGLPNRRMQKDNFCKAAARAHRSASRVGLLFIDLDGFKFINDSHGHAAGDAVLRQVAGRLQSILRAGDSVCRHGGDEFILLLGDVFDRDAVAAIATRVINTVQEPIEVGGRQFSVGSSIGISIYPDDGEDFDSLLRQADTALYRAKRNGRGTLRFFDSTLDHEETATKERKNANPPGVSPPNVRGR